MKMKTLIACAATAAALPLTTAWATQPTGPQGIDWWGHSGVGFAQMDRNGDGMISREEYATADQRGVTGRARVYSGPSAETNPPVPAP